MKRRSRRELWIRTGNILFTHDDILDGQQVFLRNGLMEYGSIFGHGAYLGPDYTADYLRRSAASVYEIHGGQKSDSANSADRGRV